MLAQGFAFVTPTVHKGEIVTRFAIVNPRTTLTDIKAILDTHAVNGSLIRLSLSRRPQRVLVMKFGGSSVADADKIRSVAERLVAAHETGRQVVGVVSAMGKTTDQLVALAADVSPHPHPREMDMLLSTGERISAALCAMAIEDLGHRAVSLTGSQAGIVTDTVPHQGEDRGDPAAPHRGGARTR